MGLDAFGLFRGWCRDRPSCLEYRPRGEPGSASDAQAIRCATCGCLPQQHVPAQRQGYDPHSEAQVALRKQYDASLLAPAECAAKYKAAADDAFRKKNYRTAYEGYTAALEATPDDAVLLGNRCQAYLRVGRLEPALADAETAVRLRPEWGKAHYRLGSCLARLERHEGAIGAFERACELEPAAAETRKALEDARKSLKAARRLDAEREEKRYETTERQAANLKTDAEWDARRRAVEDGTIAELTKWNGPAKEAWEAQYEATKQPPPNVDYLLVNKLPEQGDGSGERPALEADGDDGGELMLEANDDGSAAAVGDATGGGGGGGDGGGGDGGGGGGGDGGDGAPQSEVRDLVVLLERAGLLHELARAEAACAELSINLAREPVESVDDLDRLGLTDQFVTLLGYADDAKSVLLRRLISGREPLRTELTERGTLALAPRNYTLVHEDGRLHTRDNYEPMSFGMQQICYDAAPEPVWVQTPAGARWLQSASEVTVIAYRVPASLCHGGALRVDMAPRQLVVSARQGGQVFLHGEIERRIDPSCSTWTTDGQTVTITLAKANLELYDPSKKGVDADSHWERLMTSDQLVERGMIAANYTDLPDQMLERRRWNEAKHQHQERQIKERNVCPLCGKDVRAFCNCRDALVDYADYEKPLPQGWKDEGWSTDDYGEYDTSGQSEIRRRPPPQPAPYAGGRPQWAAGAALEQRQHAALK